MRLALGGGHSTSSLVVGGVVGGSGVPGVSGGGGSLGEGLSFSSSGGI